MHANDAIVEEILNERWSDTLDEGESLAVESHDEGGRVRAVFRLALADGSIVELEARGDEEVTGLAGEELRLFVFDALDAVLGERLEAGRTERLRGVWETREFRGVTLQVREALRTPALDARADALLGD